MKLGQELLWLSEADVTALLSMKEAVTAVENAFRLYGSKEAQMPSKIYLTLDPYGGDIRAMPAYIKGKHPSAGVKIVNSTPGNPAKGYPAVAGVLVLNDPETGLPIGLFAAGAITSIRTGAVGGLAAKYLARPNSTSVGLIGCGRQAETQLEALSLNFKLNTVKVWGRTLEESKVFCEMQKKKYDITFSSTASVEEACQADILVTTTPVREPVVKASWVKPGTHINAIGADAPGKQEISTELLLSSRLIVDDWNQCSHAGEINNLVQQGSLTREKIACELSDVVAGTKQGRTNDTDITVFDSTGLAIQDMAVGRTVFEAAQRKNKGQVLQLNG